MRISDIADLTCKPFCLAEGKYLSVLKPVLFQVLKGNKKAALIAFKHVIEHVVQRPCSPCCAQSHPWCIEDRCMGVVLGGFWIGVLLIPTTAKTGTPENEVRNENRATKHLRYDKQSFPAAQDEDRPGCS